MLPIAYRDRKQTHGYEAVYQRVDYNEESSKINVALLQCLPDTILNVDVCFTCPVR